MKIYFKGPCGEIIEPRTKNQHELPLLLMRDESGAHWYKAGGGEYDHFHFAYPGDEVFKEYSEGLYLEDKEEEHVLKGYKKISENSETYFILEAPSQDAHSLLHPKTRRIRAISDRLPRVLVKINPKDRYFEPLTPEKELIIKDKSIIHLEGLFFIFHTEILRLKTDPEDA